MGLDLVVDTDEPSVDRSLNDFLHYGQRAESDSDSSLSDYSDSEWLIKLMHPDNPAMRAVGIAFNYKAKCESVLSKVGLLKPKLEVDEDTGKCRACGDMEGFFSGFAAVEVAAAAGCPSCNILMEGVRRYIPDKRTLSSSKLGIMDSWNSGCAGRQFVRTKNTGADLPGAMGVMVGLEGSMDVKNMFTKMKEVTSEVLVELNFFGVKGVDELPT
ncbi:hypothetical protein NPX13_g9545 [Xylaria arbuscula]|uniref:Uncharacterized protein n=1 Tax=Xylaria arbuscula TaxID=114810 RepID=A0A9W8THD8_9PEZI|nr:hypothetical protein NPX13_g9545 [Xylaria arbuscula]